MSPDALRLRVFALDRLGHLAAEFTTTKQVVVGDNGARAPIRLSGTFAFDPGQLQAVVEAFADIAKYALTL